MLSDITLGQFFPGNSVIHKLDPRIKIIMSCILLIFVFIADKMLSILWLVLFTAVITTISRIPLKTFKSTLKALTFILIFSFIFISLSTSPNYKHLLFDIKIFNSFSISVYAEGIEKAIITSVRIICLIMITSIILTYTTSPIALTDGIERVLWPLKKLFKIPVHDFAMIMSIALRFIPTLLEETDRIMNAQSARGADFKNGSLISRVKALIPVFIPLLISSFRRASDLAIAMECRCYHGGDGRTKMKTLKMKSGDIVFLASVLIFCAALVAINIYSPTALELIYRFY